MNINTTALALALALSIASGAVGGPDLDLLRRLGLGGRGFDIDRWDGRRGRS